jgi:serine/threonine protein kinase
VHRDFKPSNVLFTADGKPVLSDFGIARPTLTSDSELTKQAVVMCAPRYMAPEQAQARSKGELCRAPPPRSGQGQTARRSITDLTRWPFLPPQSPRLSGTAMAEHSLNHAKESQQALDSLIAKDAQEAAYQIAEVYAWRGEKDKAFEWLERAYQQRDSGLSEIKHE